MDTAEKSKRGEAEKMRNAEKLRRLLRTAVFTALTCAATVVIQIPMVGTNGYVNIGDCFVLLGAWLLGPACGAFAGGVGSALADLLTGYLHYVPATLLIKAAMAVVAALISAASRHAHFARFVSALLAELWMVAGYFGFAWLLQGSAFAAAGSIVGNLMQGAVGMVGALGLMAALRAAKVFEHMGGIQNG